MNRLLFIFLFVFQCSQIDAKQWHTANGGWWDDSTTWVGGIPASYSISDSVFIHHRVRFRKDIYFSKSYFQVDSTGGLCGFFTIHFGIGGQVIQYGPICCDSMLISGTVMKTYGPGNLLVRKSMQVKGPAPASYSKLTGGVLKVGTDYDCNTESGFREILDVRNNILGHLSIYPVPFQKSLQFKVPLDGFDYELGLYSTTGELICSFQGELQNGSIPVEVPDIAMPDHVFYRLRFPGLGESSGLLQHSID